MDDFLMGHANEGEQEVFIQQAHTEFFIGGGGGGADTEAVYIIYVWLQNLCRNIQVTNINTSKHESTTC
jgi:hypothetical protein